MNGAVDSDAEVRQRGTVGRGVHSPANGDGVETFHRFVDALLKFFVETGTHEVCFAFLRTLPQISRRCCETSASCLSVSTVTMPSGRVQQSRDTLRGGALESAMLAATADRPLGGCMPQHGDPTFYCSDAQ